MKEKHQTQCSYCKRVLTDNGWIPEEDAILDDLRSHGICEDCYELLDPGGLEDEF